MGRVPSRSVERHAVPVLVYLLSMSVRCILLLEDLDAAFTRGISRDEKSTGVPTTTSGSTTTKKDSDDDGGSTLSLSGLLNSLDGVAAAEGR